MTPGFHDDFNLIVLLTCLHLKFMANLMCGVCSESVLRFAEEPCQVQSVARVRNDPCASVCGGGGPQKLLGGGAGRCHGGQ